MIGRERIVERGTQVEVNHLGESILPLALHNRKYVEVSERFKTIYGENSLRRVFVATFMTRNQVEYSMRFVRDISSS